MWRVYVGKFSCFTAYNFEIPTVSTTFISQLLGDSNVKQVK